MFIAIFTVELIIKLLGEGVIMYLRDNFNAFDLLIIIVSYVDLVITHNKGNINTQKFSSIAGILSLRAFRILRIFKIAKIWRSFL